MLVIHCLQEISIFKFINTYNYYDKVPEEAHNAAQSTTS